MPNPREVAVLIVNGQKYEDWTSVWVEARITEWYPIFQFECTEFDNKGIRQMTQAALYKNLRIKPGDVVEVYLAGFPAVLGYVTERHVAYDANNHGVKIVGKGKSFDLTTTSVWSQGGSYDNQSWSQLARALIAPAGVGLAIKGAIDETPYEQIQVQPGEIISQALERYARQRKIVLGSTEKGELLAIGDHPATAIDALVEGKNILRAAGVIKDENVYSRIYAIGQKNSNDSSWGDKSNKIIGQTTGKSSRDRVIVTPMDVADDKHGAQQRAEMEKIFTDGGMVEHHITVQGWLRNSGAIWRAGEYYLVQSPMLITNNTMGAKSVTYEQDNARGTITTLQMVDPAHMSGRPDMSGSAPQLTDPNAQPNAAPQRN